MCLLWIKNTLLNGFYGFYLHSKPNEVWTKIPESSSLCLLFCLTVKIKPLCSEKKRSEQHSWMLFLVVLFCSILKICQENKDAETNQFSLIAANPIPCLIWWSHSAPKIVYKKLSATCKLIVICMSSATYPSTLPSTHPVCTKPMDGVFQSLDFCLETWKGYMMVMVVMMNLEG